MAEAHGLGGTALDQPFGADLRSDVGLEPNETGVGSDGDRERGRRIAFQDADPERQLGDPSDGRGDDRIGGDRRGWNGLPRRVILRILEQDRIHPTIRQGACVAAGQLADPLD